MNNTESSRFEQVLAELRVSESTLGRAEKTALDHQGYLVIPDVIDSAWLKQLCTVFEDLAQEERTAGRREGGTRHLPALELKGELFYGLLTHPTLLAAAWHVLKCPVRTGGVDGRDPLPGHGLQGIHRDAPPRAPGSPFSILNSLWLLDDYTAENGATRVVPGSHLVTEKTPKIAGDPEKSFPGEMLIRAKAGSVLLFNGHTLHGGTRNRSSRSRRVLRCAYSPRSGRRQFGEEERTPDPSLPPVVRYLLGE